MSFEAGIPLRQLLIWPLNEEIPVLLLWPPHLHVTQSYSLLANCLRGQNMWQSTVKGPDCMQKDHPRR